MKRSTIPAYLQEARDAAGVAAEYAKRTRAEVDRLERAIADTEAKREVAMRNWRTGSEPPPAVIEAGVALSALRDRLDLARADLDAAHAAREHTDGTLAAAELRHDLQTAADAELALWPRLVAAIEEVDAVAREARQATAGVMARAQHPKHHTYLCNPRDRTRPSGLANIARRVHALAAGSVAARLRDADLPGLYARVNPKGKR